MQKNTDVVATMKCPGRSIHDSVLWITEWGIVACVLYILSFVTWVRVWSGEMIGVCPPAQPSLHRDERAN
jgi:hypothetical protein